MAAIASLNVNALFGKKAPAKKAPAKKGPAKKAPVRSAGTKRQGNIGPNRTLWNGWESNPEPPAYLDGSLPGDAGFDPFGLSKPVEYLQFDLDSLDGSAAVNPIGQVIGKLKKVDNAPTERTIVVRKNAISARRGLARWQLPPRSTRPETGARTARRESIDAFLARNERRERRSRGPAPRIERALANARVVGAIARGVTRIPVFHATENHARPTSRVLCFPRHARPGARRSARAATVSLTRRRPDASYPYRVRLRTPAGRCSAWLA